MSRLMHYLFAALTAIFSLCTSAQAQQYQIPECCQQANSPYCYKVDLFRPGYCNPYLPDKFPMKAIVAREGAKVLDLSFKPVKKLKAKEKITLEGLLPCGTCSRDAYSGLQFEYYYTIDNGKHLVRTSDVILKSRIDKPAYVSSSGKIKVVANPTNPSAQFLFPPQGHEGYIDHIWEGQDPLALDLWLIKRNGFVFLDHNCNSCNLKECQYTYFSPDESLVFIEDIATLVQADGSLFWEAPKGFVNTCAYAGAYSSPTWHGEYLFMRGEDRCDSVYRLNLLTKKFERFIYAPDGTPPEWEDTNMTWAPVVIEDGRIKARFIRINEDANEEESNNKGCIHVDLVADMEGKIISSTTTFGPTDDCY